MACPLCMARPFRSDSRVADWERTARQVTMSNRQGPSGGQGEVDSTQLTPVRTCCTSSSRADTARLDDACSGQRSLPLRSASAPGGSRATRGYGSDVVGSGRGRRALCGAAPQRPARYASRSARPLPTTIRSADRRRGKRATSGGAGRSGSKRLDPGAPTTPRPAIAGRPRACRRYTRLPLPPFSIASSRRYETNPLRDSSACGGPTLPHARRSAL
jgi:hypothetical protein